MATTKITRKGQVTIPAAIRHKLDLKEGDILAVKESDGKVVLESQRGIVERIAGSLSAYAKNGPPLTDDEMDEVIAQAIVEDYLQAVKD